MSLEFPSSVIGRSIAVQELQNRQMAGYCQKTEKVDTRRDGSYVSQPRRDALIICEETSAWHEGTGSM